MKIFPSSPAENNKFVSLEKNKKLTFELCEITLSNFGIFIFWLLLFLSLLKLILLSFSFNS
jgi:hypothetical protein